MMKNAGKIILIVLGIALIALGIKGLMDIPTHKAILEAAVYLDESVVLPENEGKLVIIHGAPEMLAPACDEELGLTLNTIKAVRYAEEYQRVSKEEQIEKYNWVSKASKGIIGKAAMGSFELDEKLINAFSADKDYENFDMAQLSEKGYKTGYGKTKEGARTERLWVFAGDAYYYDPFEYNPIRDASHYERELDRELVEERNGTKAYAYKVFTLNENAEWTIAGIQQGERLVADETIGPMVRNGALTKEQVLSANSNGIIGGAAVFMALGAVLVFLGVRKPKSKQKGK